MWLWLVPVALAVSPNCPLFTCDVLPQDMCANITSLEDKTVSLNSLGCSPLRCCDLTNITKALAEQRLDSFSCDPFPGTIPSYGDPSGQCPLRRSQRNLVEGYHPKECQSNLDCKLADGSFLNCTCGMSRFKVCQPDINDEIYIGFWDYCSKNENRLTDEVRYMWGYYYINFVVMMSAPTCADDVLIQLWMLLGAFGSRIRGSLVVLTIFLLQ